MNTHQNFSLSLNPQKLLSIKNNRNKLNYPVKILLKKNTEKMSCRPCTFEYSKGNGNGVAEAVHNWGFSNEVASPGHELSRMDCIIRKMEALREPPKCCPPRKRKCAPVPCVFEHSPPECRPSWFFPEKSPTMCYNSVHVTHLSSDKFRVRHDAANPLNGRRICFQRNDKWYRLGPLCCPQPSCPAPWC